MKNLNLEFRDNFKRAKTTFGIGNTIVMVTPPLNEDYWVFRIKLHEDQALVAFPKFGLIGIGFAIEEDWNTNLPSTCGDVEIYNHIKCNKKYKEITRKTCIEAIIILQKAADYYIKNEMTAEELSNEESYISYMNTLATFVQK
jgi:hypothetical protein